MCLKTNLSQKVRTVRNPPHQWIFLQAAKDLVAVCVCVCWLSFLGYREKKTGSVSFKFIMQRLDNGSRDNLNKLHGDVEKPYTVAKLVLEWEHAQGLGRQYSHMRTGEERGSWVGVLCTSITRNL